MSIIGNAGDEKSVAGMSKRAIKFAMFEAARSLPEPPEDARTTPFECIPPGRLKIGKAKIKYLSSLIQQLVELRNAPDEEDDHGILRATKHAFDLSCNLLVDAAILSAREARQIPYGCASTDSTGGIRIEWVRDSASVHVVIPADEERDAYIYHEEGAKYDTEAVTAEAIARWLSIIVD